jgi:hypothetical protein
MLLREVKQIDRSSVADSQLTPPLCQWTDGARKLVFSCGICTIQRSRARGRSFHAPHYFKWTYFEAIINSSQATASMTVVWYPLTRELGETHEAATATWSRRGGNLSTCTLCQIRGKMSERLFTHSSATLTISLGSAPSRTNSRPAKPHECSASGPASSFRPH